MAKYNHVLLDEKYHNVLKKTVEKYNLGTNKAYVTSLLLQDKRFKNVLRDCSNA